MRANKLRGGYSPQEGLEAFDSKRKRARSSSPLLSLSLLRHRRLSIFQPRCIVFLVIILSSVDTMVRLQNCDAFQFNFGPVQQTLSRRASPGARTARTHAQVSSSPLDWTTSTSTTTSLHVSSILTWFSMAGGKRNQELTSSSHTTQESPIFFKRPKGHNKTQSSRSDNDHGASDINASRTIANTSTSASASTSTSTTWAALLHDDPEEQNHVSEDEQTQANMYKRQQLQYGIFTSKPNVRKQAQEEAATWAPISLSFQLPTLPEYYSNWATTLSSTLHNTTSNAWKVAPVNVSVPSSSPRSAAGAVSELQPHDTLTVADLEAILRADGYLRQQDLLMDNADLLSVGSASKVRVGPNNKYSKAGGPGSSTAKSSLAVEQPDTSLAAASSILRKTKSGVAFPQPSVLDHMTLQRGVTVASAFFGLLAATTLLPNLWLMGALAGGLYGWDLCKHPDEPPPSHALARILIGSGRRITKAVLQFLDYTKTLWFLYKTGELSYQYYKQYEEMDKRFALQNKMDAWNERFQQGKVQFDAWEQEHEIGRTLLAGMRTVWLVDERAKRRRHRQSRYRLVQSLYDAKHWSRRTIRRALKNLAQSDWMESSQEYLTGIQTDLFSSGSGWGARIGSVLASVLVVSVTGALFALSPFLLALVAVLVGIAWPSWVSELVGRFSDVWQETRARGRGEPSRNNDLVPFSQQQQKLLSRRSRDTARLLGRYDKTKYHWFQRSDGSKRYYRSGQSLFGARQRQAAPKQPKGPAAPLAWPWAKPQRIQRPPGKEQWGVFGPQNNN